MSDDRFTREPERHHPSRLDFDRTLVGAPPAGFEEHLAACTACRDEHERRRVEQAAFAASEEPRRAAARILERGRRASWPWLSLGAVALAAAGFGLFVGLGTSSAPGGIRTKGGPTLDGYVKRAEGAPLRWPGPAAGPLRAGDAVQIGYRAPGYAKVSVFALEHGCDVRRELTQDAELEGMIARSWVLTGDDGDERLYVAFSSREVTPEEIASALRAIPGGCDGRRAPDVEGADFVARGLALRGAR